MQVRLVNQIELCNLLNHSGHRGNIFAIIFWKDILQKGWGLRSGCRVQKLSLYLQGFARNRLARNLFLRVRWHQRVEFNSIWLIDAKHAAGYRGKPLLFILYFCGRVVHRRLYIILDDFLSTLLPDRLFAFFSLQLFPLRFAHWFYRLITGIQIILIVVLFFLEVDGLRVRLSVHDIFFSLLNSFVLLPFWLLHARCIVLGVLRKVFFDVLLRWAVWKRLR